MYIRRHLTYTTNGQDELDCCYSVNFISNHPFINPSIIMYDFFFYPEQLQMLDGFVPPRSNDWGKKSINIIPICCAISARFLLCFHSQIWCRLHPLLSITSLCQCYTKCSKLCFSHQAFDIKSKCGEVIHGIFFSLHSFPVYFLPI